MNATVCRGRTSGPIHEQSTWNGFLGPHYRHGRRYAIVMYTGVAWDKVPAVLQRRMHELNFPL